MAIAADLLFRHAASIAASVDPFRLENGVINITGTDVNDQVTVSDDHSGLVIVRMAEQDEGGHRIATPQKVINRNQVTETSVGLADIDEFPK